MSLSLSESYSWLSGEDDDEGMGVSLCCEWSVGDGECDGVSGDVDADNDNDGDTERKTPSDLISSSSSSSRLRCWLGKR